MSGERRPRIAIDAMGGDHAPTEIVAGAVLAAADDEGTIVLVGKRGRIAPLLADAGGREIEIVDAEEEVAMDAQPAVAIRTAERTSLGIAINLVRDGRADAVVSAGNSGAFLAIALVRLRTIDGIARPAIAAVLPAKHGPVVLLDAGANVDCRPEWLVQFGIMGSAYARAVLGIADPKVGIVSVGEERAKGNAQVIEAAALLDRAPVRFIGNVEGRDVFVNAADVFVTDGFVGNVMLKLAEGAASMVSSVIRSEIESGGIPSKAGALLARPAFKRVRERLSYESYGGAPLLGLRGTCIVAHGRANRDAIRSAVRAAVAASRSDVVGKIGQLVDTRQMKKAK